MKSAFDANVPKRKPRTRLGTMLADIEVPEAEADPRPTPEVEAIPEAEANPTQVRTAEPKVDAARAEPAPAQAVVAAKAQAPRTVVAAKALAPAPKRVAAARPSRAVPGGEVVQAGRDRLEALRQRLAVAERVRQPALEPALTADRVRDTVAQLKSRLDEVLTERKGLLTGLEQARQALATAVTDVERERSDRSSADSLAEERGRVADALMAESEALADERDQALARISDLKLLDEEQSAVLQQMEEGLAQRTEELNTAQTHAEGLRSALDATQTDLSLTIGQLEEERDSAARLTREVADLQDQLSHAESAKSALSEIQRLVDGV